MSYCERTDIEDRYGVANVLDWADLDDDGHATKITNRIASTIDYASTFIDDRLRSSKLNYQLPISVDGATPSTLKDIARRIAGYYLSTARGTHRYDQKGNPLSHLHSDYKEAMAMLQQIVDGLLKMNGVL